MPNIRGPELLILVLVIVLLFGAKRLPDAARSVGRSLRIFKAETKGLVDGETAADTEASASGQATPEPKAAPAALPPAQQAPAAGAPPIGSAGAPVADHALAPQADPSAPSLQSQPPSQA